MSLDSPSRQFPSVLLDHRNEKGALVFVLDATVLPIRAALFLDGENLAEETSTEHPLKGIFQVVQQCFAQTEFQLSDVASFVCSAGPGNPMAIRQASVAMHAWQQITPQPSRIFSLHNLVALQYLLSGNDDPAPIAFLLKPNTWVKKSGKVPLDWNSTLTTVGLESHLKGGSWYGYEYKDGILSEWPPFLKKISYTLNDLLRSNCPDKWLNEVERIIPVEAPVRSYVRWKPERHKMSKKQMSTNPS